MKRKYNKPIMQEIDTDVSIMMLITSPVTDPPVHGEDPWAISNKMTRQVNSTKSAGDQLNYNAFEESPF